MNSRQVLIVSTLLLVVAFIPQLSGYAFNNGDAIRGFYPLFTFYQEHLSAGSPFLWSRGLISGFPLYLDLSGGFFSPVNRILFSILSVTNAYAAALAFGTLLLLIWTYLYARKIGISYAGSLLAAIAFAFGSHAAHWADNLAVLNGLFSLPFLMYCVLKIFEGRLVWSLIGGAGLGYALTTSQPQWVFMALLASGFYVLWNVWEGRQMYSRGMVARSITAFLLLVFFGALIALPQFIATRELTVLSARSAGLSFSDAQISSITPVDFLWYLIPFFQLKYLSALEPVLYIGIIPFICAILALWHTREKRQHYFFVFLFFFGLVAAIRYSPLFWILHQLPIFEYFRGANRWMYIGTFGLTVLAGFGWDLLHVHVRTRDAVRTIIKYALIGWGIVAGVASIIFWLFGTRIVIFVKEYFDAHYYEKTTKLPIEHYHNAIDALLSQAFANFNLINSPVIFSLLFGVISLWLLGWYIRNQKRETAILLLGVSFLNLIVFHPNYTRIFRSVLLQERPVLADVITAKETDPHKVRVLTVLGGSAIHEKLRTPFYNRFTESDVIELSRDMLDPNMNMLYGIDSADGYNNLMSRRNSRILALVGSEHSTIGDSLAYAPVPLSEKLNLFLARLPLMAMMNIKYIISAYILPDTANLSLMTTISSTRFAIPLYLYENTAALSRIYLASSVRFFPTTDEVQNFNAISAPGNDFSKVTFIECSACADTGRGSFEDSLKINDYLDGFLEVTTRTVASRWLVFSESNLPGWQASIDGISTSIHTANYLFQGILIPPGEHTLRVEYKR